jgi:hypothetical protein
VTGKQRVSAFPVVLNSVEDMEMEAASVAPRAQKQAPPLPVIVLVALEIVATSEAEPAYHRAFAWYRLVRYWASLRFDNTVGLLPSSMVHNERGLTATIGGPRPPGRASTSSPSPSPCRPSAT